MDNYVHIMRRVSMNYYYITDPGKVRERNEDCVSVVENGTLEKLLIVADG